MAWKPYPHGRLVEERPEGFVVIVPIDAPKPLPIACPVCGYALRSWEDEAACVDLGCCDRCAQLWARPRRAEWVAGWRPTEEQVRDAEASRVPLSIAMPVG